MKTSPKKKSPNQTSGRSVLILIAGLFLASGLIRLVDGTGEAIAKEVGNLTLGESNSVAATTCDGADGIGDLLSAIGKREKRVAEKEAMLADRMQILAVAETELKRNMDALVAAESSLKKTMTLANNAADDDLTRLTTVYESMKAKDAATLFEEMDPTFSAALGRMRPDAAAAILAGISPQKAYTVSVILAGRNARVPTE